MPVIKCKMCGANISFRSGASTGSCVCCGTMQTLPRADDEAKETDLNYANDLRCGGRFEEAAAVLESVLSKDDSDPEVYWLLALCRYCVRYSKAPGSGRMVPSVGKKLAAPFPEDTYYRSAERLADDIQKWVYSEEAKAIETVRCSLSEDTETPEAAVSGTTDDPSDCVREAFERLESKDFNGAVILSDRALAADPGNARAYAAKLLADLHLTKIEDLRNSLRPFDANKNYQMAVKTGGEDLTEALRNYAEAARTSYEKRYKADLFRKAAECFNSAKSESDFIKASELFRKIPGYQNADALAERCLLEAENCRKDAVYAEASALMTGSEKNRYEDAASKFASLEGWKDSGEKILACQEKIREIEAEEEAKRLAKREKKKKTGIALCIAALAMILCAAIFVLAVTVIVPLFKYNAAVSLYGAGKYEEAAEAFAELEEYRDSEELLKKSKAAYDDERFQKAQELYNSGKYEESIEILDTIYYHEGASELIEKCCIAMVGEETYNRVKDIKVGGTVTMGKYEQDADESNGPEDIEWIVLDRRGMSFLVISKYALEVTAYNSENVRITWKDCTLRRWMNNDFYNSAFTDEERSSISLTVNTNDPESKYNTYLNEKTEDYVFLLSLDEAERYLGGKEEMKCEPTMYVKDKGGYISGVTTVNEGHCWWWLRSPGDNKKLAAEVCHDGSFDLYGRKVGYRFDVARP
nr:DUF6273 domain-containing protein [Clostridia bacterium]